MLALRGWSLCLPLYMQKIAIKFIGVYSEGWDKFIFNSPCVRCWFSATGNLVLHVHDRRFITRLNKVFDLNGLLNLNVLDFLGNHAYEFVSFIKEEDINVKDFDKEFKDICSERL